MNSILSLSGWFRRRGVEKKIGQSKKSVMRLLVSGHKNGNTEATEVLMKPNCVKGFYFIRWVVLMSCCCCVLLIYIYICCDVLKFKYIMYSIFVYLLLIRLWASEWWLGKIEIMVRLYNPEHIHWQVVSFTDNKPATSSIT